MCVLHEYAGGAAVWDVLTYSCMQARRSRAHECTAASAVEAGRPVNARRGEQSGSDAVERLALGLDR